VGCTPEGGTPVVVAEVGYTLARGTPVVGMPVRNIVEVRELPVVRGIVEGRELVLVGDIVEE